MTEAQTDKEQEVFVSKAKNIHEAINEVMGRVGYVQKKKAKDGGLKYSFAGEAALIEALRPALVESGVTFYCSEIRNHAREVVRTTKVNNGQQYESISYFTTGLFVFHFTHAPSGSCVIVSALGEGYDSLDKGAYKAMTGALKYALRQTFIIETGDDPDKTQEEHDKNPPATKQQPKPPAQIEQKERLEKQFAWYKGQLDKLTLAIEYDDLRAKPSVQKFLQEVKEFPDIGAQVIIAQSETEGRLGVVYE